MILDHGVEFLFCTPTYACRLLDTAKQKNISLNRNRLQKIIVAGECGGSDPYTRKMLDQAWGKSSIVCDHYGMTEVGPVAYEMNEGGRGMHIMLSSYYPEVIDPQTTNPVEEGQVGELVLTPLGRWGTPLLRYRTGDLVRAYKGSNSQGMPTFFLEGGILGRVDDMVVVRGVNIYPSAVDSTVRAFSQIHEYQVVVEQSRAMSEMLVRAECEPSVGKLWKKSLGGPFFTSARGVCAGRFATKV